MNFRIFVKLMYIAEMMGKNSLSGKLPLIPFSNKPVWDVSVCFLLILLVWRVKSFPRANCKPLFKA